MKRMAWMTAALLITAMICGCGGEDKKSSNATAQLKRPASATATVPAPAGHGTAAFKSSTPKEAVAEFLDALRAGNKSTTEALLTAKARKETLSHDLVVEPPGAPGATYSIGRVQSVEGDAGAAYVSCVWSEKEDDTEFEVVWILRKESVGWRIAGMATQLPDVEEPIVLNFEDLSELENAMREAEVAQRQNTAPAAGQSTTTVR